jgi:NADPH-dependent 2,4-dienoyl-CoA reductase/sulfur reductase-like enzyme
MAQFYPYLIVGGGMAADAAVRGIRQVDQQGSIGLIGQESDPPYNRPPLSKGLWKRTPLSRIWRGTQNLGVDLHLGRSIVHLNPAQKLVVDDQGEEYSYERLLLATGGDPIRLAPDSERLIYYRTLADYHRLRTLMDTAQRFAVIGGGFIGSEMAAALAGQGKDVTMIFPEDGIGARILPAEVSQSLNGVFESKGIQVLTGEWCTLIETLDNSVAVTTGTERLEFDGVVAGLGIRPNIALAKAAGLAVGDGIQVDPFLRTSHPSIFAAGDVALFYNPTLEMWMRVEHEENANLTGQYTGMGMAGELTRYEHLPSVYSTLFELQYDAVGDLDPALDIVYDWQEPYQKGTVYYLRDGRVRGVLLLNASRGLDAARSLIAESGPFLPADLAGRIQF